VLARDILLSPFGSAAFHDAVANETAAQLYFTTLLALLRSQQMVEEVFAPYVHRIRSLPVREGMSWVATWQARRDHPFPPTGCNPDASRV